MKKVWLVRDKAGRLEMYPEKPKEVDGIFFNIHGCIGLLPREWFPEITLENSPVQCQLIIE